jgi:DNA-binding transcriptional ArsR family regulator
LTPFIVGEIFNRMMNQLETTFAALAEPTRFRVVGMLRGRELSAGELATRCATSNPAMSRHLRVLRKSGIVEIAPSPRAEQDARLRVYRLRPDPFVDLKDWIDQMQQFWGGQLSAFKAYAERKQALPVPRAKRQRRTKQ